MNGGEKMTYDVIIVGAGSIGMAAGYYLSTKGAKVLLVDRYDPPHDQASHHGDTRIIRHAYGEGKHYVELALRSQQLWHELETQMNQDLFMQTGVLNLGLETSEFIQGVIESAETYELPLETMTASDVESRWDGWNVPDRYLGCYEKQSGVLRSEVCVRTYREGIIANGGEVLSNCIIHSIIEHRNGIELNTSAGNFSSEQLMVTAGAGTNEVLALIGEQLPLTTVRKTFSWFHQPAHMYAEKDFPAFTCDTEFGIYYGFPNIAGAGVKIGRHDGGHKRDMSKANLPFGHYEEDEADVITFAKTFLSPQVVHRTGRPCTYTLSPDNDFIIDYLPHHKNILVACGLSGHGFKFSSAIGEALSQLAISGKSDADMTVFSSARF